MCFSLHIMLRKWSAVGIAYPTWLRQSIIESKSLYVETLDFNIFLRSDDYEILLWSGRDRRSRRASYSRPRRICISSKAPSAKKYLELGRRCGELAHLYILVYRMCGWLVG